MDTIDQLRVLFSILSGQAAGDALVDERSSGSATMAMFSEPFVKGLSEIRAEARWIQLGEQWLSATKWPRTMGPNGLSTRVVYWGALARRAQQKGFNLYCWRGPSVPTHVLVQGVGKDSYEAYRRVK
jgi:hypothetical protein